MHRHPQLLKNRSSTSSNQKQQISPVFDPSNPENSSLKTLLEQQEFPLLQLLKVKNIQSKIRSQLTYFLKFCRNHEQFCYHLIDIGIKCPMHESNDQNMKNVTYIAADILTSDQDVLAELFIIEPEKDKQDNLKNRKVSECESQEFEQIEQLLENFEQQPKKGNMNSSINSLNQPSNLSGQQKFQQKYKFLLKMTDYITQNQRKDLDENCINYMIKAMNCLIRVKPQLFCLFLLQKSLVLQRLLQLNQFSSINQLMIKILSSDDLDQAEFSEIKRIIIDKTLRKIQESLAEPDFIERLDFIDELFQTNKYSSDDERTMIQKLSDVFVSQNTIQFFFESFLKPRNIHEFYNSCSYLTAMVKRQNVDEQDDPCSYGDPKKQPTMLFHLQILYNNFIQLVELGVENFSKLTALVKSQQIQAYYFKKVLNRFYEFLVVIALNKKFCNCVQQSQSSGKHDKNFIFKTKQQKINTIKQILLQFAKQESNGVNRINLIFLIEKILKIRIFTSKQVQQDKKDQPEMVSKIEQCKQQSKKQSGEGLTQSVVLNEGSHEQQFTGHKKEELKSSDFDQKQVQNSPSVHHQEDITEKKKKISKLKIGLKLNIKKFNLQDLTNSNQQKSSENKDEADHQRQTEKVKASTEQTHQQLTLEEIESSITLEQAMSLLRYFKQNISNQMCLLTNTLRTFRVRRLYNENQSAGFINKIIILISNQVQWSGQDKVILEKQKQVYFSYISQVFKTFKFDKIVEEYAITLATPRHPNNKSSKCKTNPELCFIQTFIQKYSSKNPTPTPYIVNKQKNNNLNDSDFMSDDDLDDLDEDENIVVVKCSLDDIKNNTAFKFESNNQKEGKNLVKSQQELVASELSNTQNQEIKRQDQKKLLTMENAICNPQKPNHMTLKVSQQIVQKQKQPESVKNRIQNIDSKLVVNFIARHLILF